MEQRVTELEIKVAYLERTVGELDGLVRVLSEQMDLLRREVARLRASEQRQEPPPSEQPPHY
jgi:uncharacterized coiled-coil protein SlyX